MPPSETDQLEADLRATYKRLFPLRHSETKEFSDEILTLGVLLRNKSDTQFAPNLPSLMDPALPTQVKAGTKVVVKCPPRYAEGAGFGATAKSKRKGKKAD